MVNDGTDHEEASYWAGCVSSLGWGLHRSNWRITGMWMLVYSIHDWQRYLRSKHLPLVHICSVRSINFIAILQRPLPHQSLEQDLMDWWPTVLKGAENVGQIHQFLTFLTSQMLVQSSHPHWFEICAACSRKGDQILASPLARRDFFRT